MNVYLFSVGLCSFLFLLWLIYKFTKLIEKTEKTQPDVAQMQRGWRNLIVFGAMGVFVGMIFLLSGVKLPDSLGPLGVGNTIPERSERSSEVKVYTIEEPNMGVATEEMGKEHHEAFEAFEKRVGGELEE